MNPYHNKGNADSDNDNKVAKLLTEARVAKNDHSRAEDYADMKAYVYHQRIDLVQCVDYYPLIAHLIFINSDAARSLIKAFKVAPDTACHKYPPLYIAMVVERNLTHVKALCEFDAFKCKELSVYTMRTTCSNGIKGDCDSIACCPKDGALVFVAQHWEFKCGKPSIVNSFTYPLTRFCDVGSAIAKCVAYDINTCEKALNSIPQFTLGRDSEPYVPGTCPPLDDAFALIGMQQADVHNH